MINSEAIKNVIKILEENKDEKVCIFINGKWGIGKTYIIESIKKEKDFERKIDSITVFGKQDIKEIEKDILMQMYLGGEFKKIGNLVSKWMSKKIDKTIGVEIDFIKNISIENCSNEKNTIICIDDLERKSESISINNLLGLIERASMKFNVILIANIDELSEEEKKNFIKFKEKVIDYEFTIDSLSEEVLNEILRKKIGNIEERIVKEIINCFKKYDKVSKNLRIYKKYIDLIYRIDREGKQVTDFEGIKIDSKMIELCYNVVIENNEMYKENIKSKRKVSYRERELKKVIEKIFKYEEYDIEILKDYCDDLSEIQEDINNLYNVYKLSEKELNRIIEKIRKNIELRNKEYFRKQKYMINLYDAFCEIGIIDEFKEKFIERIKNLYEPKINEKPKKFNEEDYNNVDFIEGENTNRNVYEIINEINKWNYEQYRKLIEKELSKAIEGEKIDKINEVIKYMDYIEIGVFKKIYKIAFNGLEKSDNKLNWKVLSNIIDKGENSAIKEFFNCEKNKNNHGIVLNARLQYFMDILLEKEYFEYQDK